MLYLDSADTVQTLVHFKQYIDLVRRGEKYDFARAEVDSIDATILRAAEAAEALKQAKKNS